MTQHVDRRGRMIDKRLPADFLASDPFGRAELADFIAHSRAAVVECRSCKVAIRREHYSDHWREVHFAAREIDWTAAGG